MTSHYYPDTLSISELRNAAMCTLGSDVRNGQILTISHKAYPAIMVSMEAFQKIKPAGLEEEKIPSIQVSQFRRGKVVERLKSLARKEPAVLLVHNYHWPPSMAAISLETYKAWKSAAQCQKTV